MRCHPARMQSQAVLLASLTIPGAPAYLHAARAFVARTLGDGCACSDTAVLLTSELVTNSVQHSSDPGGTAGSDDLPRPRPQGARARQRLPFMCCNRTRPRSGLVHFPHAGHPWPGQQWQSNPRGPAPGWPQNLTRRHLPDQPGMLMQPWNPGLIKHRSPLHEPTEGLPLHTLSRTALGRSPASASVRASTDSRPAATREPP